MRYGQRRAREEGVGKIYNNEITNKKNESYGFANFSFQYEYGESITAVENGDGEISIIVETKKGNIDLKSYLPEGYKFVSKRYYDQVANEKGVEFRDFAFGCAKGWKFIIIRELTDARYIFAILHEMGHALIEKDEIESFDYTIKTSSLKGPRVLNETLSEEERKAWANALHLVRRLQSESGIDVLRPFGSLEEAQKFIYTRLASYRYTGELEFEKNNAKLWFKSLFGKVLGEEDRRFMEQLFDRRKLTRKHGKLKSK